MKKRILVAPLNWGLGHATRCIPIIRNLIQHNFEPVIASDGMPLDLLKKEFPELETIALPAYNISYSKQARFFKLKLIKDSPKLIKAIKAEKIATDKIIDDYSIDGIISDNRLGVYSKKVPSVFITHQLRVLSGNTTWFSTKMHSKFINKFNECWVPDVVEEPSLSGKLGHVDSASIPVKYLGPLSRFNKTESNMVYDFMVLLSGPEPQRTFLEDKLMDELDGYPGQIVFVKGIIENEIKVSTSGNLTIYNFMTSDLLEKAINQSDFVVSRSGYTTIMDLAKLNKKAFFIPTPGQFEQEYLAERLSNQGFVPSSTQDDFTLDKLKGVSASKGLEAFEYANNYKDLFRLFEGE